MDESSVAAELLQNLKFYRNVYRKKKKKYILGKKCGCGTLEKAGAWSHLFLVLLVYRGPGKGMGLPRENRKRKSIINMTWIRKLEFECWVLPFIRSVALAL